MSKNEKPKSANPSSGTGLTPFEEMDRAFDELFGHRWPRAWMRPFRWEHPSLAEMPASIGKIPRVDVIDGETEIMVRAEVPGFRKEDLDVSMNEESVTIRGHTAQEEKTESENYYRSEISRGEFVRTVGLPSAVDAAKATAKLENGILELTLPKVERAKRHSIKVE